METTPIQKIAGILKALMTATFVCNLIALPMVPGLVRARYLTAYLGPDDPEHAWLSAWPELVLIAFLIFCGCCTAVILWQGRRVLDTILREEPFSMENAVSLRRAAWASFVISAAALVRVVFSLCFYRSPVPLFSYNALFVPIFAMFGLLCLVMSALFRQAAELKAENDLTI